MDPGQRRAAAPRAVPSLCADYCPTPLQACVAPAAWAGGRRAAGIVSRVDLKGGLRTLGGLGDEALGLAQLLRDQAGAHAAALGRAEAGHGGSTQASGGSANLTDVPERKANKQDLRTPSRAVACEGWPALFSSHREAADLLQHHGIKDWSWTLSGSALSILPRTRFARPVYGRPTSTSNTGTPVIWQRRPSYDQEFSVGSALCLSPFPSP